MSLLLHACDIDVTGSESPLGFETVGAGSWSAWYRYLTLDGKRAYELGNTCGTCAFFFERMAGANEKIEVKELVARLATGIEPDDRTTLQLLSAMIPDGHYSVNVVELVPEAIELGKANDYFVQDQQAVWGLDGFWGLPHHPKVPYYRTGTRSISATQRLFEFVMPMYPHNWLDPEQVGKYRTVLGKGCKPTAVAVSLLDVKGAAVSECEESEHWCLAHYVLDGHHKIEAAAQAHKPITLVSFLAHHHGVSTLEEVSRVRGLLNFI